MGLILELIQVLEKKIVLLSKTGKWFRFLKLGIMSSFLSFYHVLQSRSGKYLWKISTLNKLSIFFYAQSLSEIFHLHHSTLRSDWFLVAKNNSQKCELVQNSLLKLLSKNRFKGYCCGGYLKINSEAAFYIYSENSWSWKFH